MKQSIPEKIQKSNDEIHFFVEKDLAINYLLNINNT